MFFMENEKISLTGKSDDLLTILDDGRFKMTRLFLLNNEDDQNEETLSLEFTSFSKNKVHSTFDKFLGKDIEITIRALS